jgi:hypothetical protein
MYMENHECRLFFIDRIVIINHYYSVTTLKLHRVERVDIPKGWLLL